MRVASIFTYMCVCMYIYWGCGFKAKTSAFKHPGGIPFISDVGMIVTGPWCIMGDNTGEPLTHDCDRSDPKFRAVH